MAYDPYARGSDNPWLGNLDMPKSQPTAKPGTSRAASLAPAKKKPLPKPEVQGPPMPMPEVQGPPMPLPGGAQGPPVPMPEVQGPPIPAGIGVGPPPGPAIGSPAPAMPPPRPQQMAGIPGGILQPGFFDKLFGQRPVA
jgi:hypothetical protein